MDCRSSKYILIKTLYQISCKPAGKMDNTVLNIRRYNQAEPLLKHNMTCTIKT